MFVCVFKGARGGEGEKGTIEDAARKSYFFRNALQIITIVINGYAIPVNLLVLFLKVY